MLKICNYINGEFVAPVSGKYIENINPATNTVINLVPDSDYRDVEIAVNAAKNAYKTWGKLHFTERAPYLLRIAASMKQEFEALASADSIDMGKPIKEMIEQDVPEAIDEFDRFSRMIETETTPYYQMSDAIAFEHRNPIGLIGCISPWNFPLWIMCLKISVAIVCGNCVICKPSELTPTSMNLCCAIFDKVGIPKGVINMVHGYGSKAGEAITSNDDICAISFTGGSVTGSRISSIAAPKLKKLQLELGGKNPAIVFNDCYFDETVREVAVSVFLNTGQVCCSTSRLIIEKGIADKFVDKLKEHVNNVYIPGIGDPLDTKTMIGPLVSKQHLEKVKYYLNLAKKEGGTIICGGKYGKHVSCKLASKFVDGNWFEPTIVVGLDHKSRCSLEEIFGPILTVHTFESEEEALRIANEVDYGLSASIWTSDIRRGQRVAREVEAGSVYINCYLYMDFRMPFGGFKKSGIQREGGRHSIDFCTEIIVIYGVISSVTTCPN